MSAPGRILVGTSGWHYPHWVGPFYPPATSPDTFLAYYARRFHTVEINNTFYRLPSAETLRAWREGTPEGFIFACKASRYMTHMKKLRDPRESGKRFFEALGALGGKRGPILFQLPPRWRVNLDRLDAFLDAVPAGHRAAFEFRDESWFTPDVLACLARHNAAFCIYDLHGRCAPIEITADFVYLRLHGPGEAYRGSYEDRVLAVWAQRLMKWARGGLDAYCYFDNDEKGFAAMDARRLLDRIEGLG